MTRSCKLRQGHYHYQAVISVLGVLVGCYLLVKTSFKFFMNKKNLSKVNIIYIYMNTRHRGRAVRALDLQFGGPEFKSRPDR